MPPLNLDHHIDDAIAAFEQERIDKWDDPVAGGKINDLADKISAVLFESATSLLTTQEQSSWRETEELIVEKLELRDELVEALQLRVAQHFFVGALPMAERTLELLRLTLRISPNEQVQRFLVAAARSHVLNLNAECAVMCRAAVENALNEKYSSSGTSWPFDKNGASPFGLKVRRAVELDWLNADAGRMAKEVWTRGSKSAHSDPSIVTKRLETISYAAAVLEQLYS